MAETRAKKAAAARKTPAERAASDVLGGRCDEQLGVIVDAIQVRIRTAGIMVRWVIELDGMTVEQDDLTLDEAYRVEKVTGESWKDIDPIAFAAHCRAVIVVCYQTRLGLDENEAMFRAGQLTAKTAVDAIRQEVRPAGAPLGGTSSSTSTPT